MVLAKSAMPSVLVELGFISNKNEEAYLTTEQGQSYMASAIYRAFKDYKMEYEKYGPSGLTNTQLPPPVEDPIITPEPPKTADKPVADPPKNTPPKTEPPKDKAVFKIQFLSSPKELPATAADLKKVNGWEMVKVNNTYKYLTGSLYNYDEAIKLQKEVRKYFPDAFMVAYKNGIKITIEEALRK
jgi:N-acetylmuramoyl-L-alanine amidase